MKTQTWGMRHVLGFCAVMAASLAAAYGQQSQIADNNAAPATPATVARTNSASGPALHSSLNTLDAEPVAGATPVVESNGPLHTCDDGISASLQQDAPNLPCWANIRTVDHWNSVLIPGADFFQQPEANRMPAEVPSSFGYTAGGIGAFVLPDGSEAKVYGGVAVAAGLIEKQRWQLMLEDAAGGGDYQLGGAVFAGLNRFAARATGEVSQRWTWQATATDTFGTDALRPFDPLDYRMIGRSEAPAADTVSYGLHTGNVLNREEGVKLRFAESERSYWDFSAGSDERKYFDDGFSVRTTRGRAEYLHAVTRDMAFGVFGEGDGQTNPLSCSLGGGGARLLSQWRSGISLNVSGGAYGASASCGKRRVQLQGDAALYLPMSTKTDVYFSADRGLGDGAVERAVFLDTGGAGVRHTFGRLVVLSLSGTALYGTDPQASGPPRNSSLHGSFAEASLRYPLALGFSQETAIRNYAVSGLAIPPNRTVAVFTLWWSPEKHRPALY